MARVAHCSGRISRDLYAIASSPIKPTHTSPVRRSEIVMAMHASLPATPPRTTSSYQSSPTPRRTPQCSQCKRPRAGHPRQGCPYSTPQSNIASDGKESGSAAVQAITGAVRAMAIADTINRSDMEKKAVIRTRRVSARLSLAPDLTLASMSTNAGALLETLPGAMKGGDTEKTEEVRRRTIVRWQENIVGGKRDEARRKEYPRSPRPGATFATK